MALTQLAIKTTFNRITGFITIEDITDYLAQGVDVNSDTVEGFLKLEYNAGAGWVALYNNIGGVTPDITPPGSYVNAVDISIPLGTDDLPLPVAYRVSYNVVVTGGVETELTNEFEYEYTFEDPEICIDATVDCGSSTLTSEDITDYEVDGTTIISISRAHKHYPPPTSGLSVTGPANLVTLSSSPIATTTWTVEEITTLTYLQDDGLYITLELSGSKEVAVTCDTKLGKILCCINNIDRTYQSLLCKNPVKAQNYFDTTVGPIWHYMTLFLAASQGGNGTKAATYYAKILEYSDCDGCSCTDTVTLVTAENSGGNSNYTYVVDSPLGTVEVTQEVNGSVITFHLEVSASILNIINNIQNLVNVVGGTDITVVAAGTNPIVFTVSYTGNAVPTQQYVRKQLVIIPGDGSLGANFLEIDKDLEILTFGTEVKPVGDHNVFLGQTSPNQSTDWALLGVSNFLDNVAKNYIAFGEVMRKDDTANGVPSDLKDIGIECFWFDPTSLTGNLIFRFYSPVTGQPYTLQQLYDLFADTSIDPATGGLYVGINIIIAPV